MWTDSGEIESFCLEYKVKIEIGSLFQAPLPVGFTAHAWPLNSSTLSNQYSIPMRS